MSEIQTSSHSTLPSLEDYSHTARHNASGAVDLIDSGTRVFLQNTHSVKARLIRWIKTLGKNLGLVKKPTTSQHQKAVHAFVQALQNTHGPTITNKLRPLIRDGEPLQADTVMTTVDKAEKMRASIYLTNIKRLVEFFPHQTTSSSSQTFRQMCKDAGIEPKNLQSEARAMYEQELKIAAANASHDNRVLLTQNDIKNLAKKVLKRVLNIRQPQGDIPQIAAHYEQAVAGFVSLFSSCARSQVEDPIAMVTTITHSYSHMMQALRIENRPLGADVLWEVMQQKVLLPALRRTQMKGNISGVKKFFNSAMVQHKGPFHDLLLTSHGIIMDEKVGYSDQCERFASAIKTIITMSLYTVNQHATGFDITPLPEEKFNQQLLVQGKSSAKNINLLAQRVAQFSASLAPALKEIIMPGAQSR